MKRLLYRLNLWLGCILGFLDGLIYFISLGYLSPGFKINFLLEWKIKWDINIINPPAFLPIHAMVFGFVNMLENTIHFLTLGFISISLSLRLIFATDWYGKPRKKLNKG